MLQKAEHCRVKFSVFLLTAHQETKFNCCPVQLDNNFFFTGNRICNLLTQTWKKDYCVIRSVLLVNQCCLSRQRIIVLTWVRAYYWIFDHWEAPQQQNRSIEVTLYYTDQGWFRYKIKTTGTNLLHEFLTKQLYLTSENFANYCGGGSCCPRQFYLPR